jgi:hypothetical protein
MLRISDFFQSLGILTPGVCRWKDFLARKLWQEIYDFKNVYVLYRLLVNINISCKSMDGH